jgi:hypothetical protein
MDRRYIKVTAVAGDGDATGADGLMSSLHFVWLGSAPLTVRFV